MRSDILRGSEGLIVGDRLHSLLAETLDGVGIFPQIELRADQDDRNVRGVMADFRVPLIRVSVAVEYRVPEHIQDLGIFKREHGGGGKKSVRTLALTLSNDGGLTMEKQMRKTSV